MLASVDLWPLSLIETFVSLSGRVILYSILYVYRREIQNIINYNKGPSKIKIGHA